MNTMFRIVLLVGVVFLFASASYGQYYYGERVQWKSFEQEEFFHRPNYILPFGIGNFKQTSAGLLNEPLMNLSINPANLFGKRQTEGNEASDNTYVYLDLRSSKEMEQMHDVVYAMPAQYATPAGERLAYVPFPYPRYYYFTRKELEPVFSGAVLTRPFGQSLDRLFIGLTYQLVMQDEKYYSIPQDIYRSVPGYDYLGVSTAPSNAPFPITDNYGGTDNMHRVGHFVSLFSGYDLTDRFQVGVKLSRTFFSRDGEIGSQNLMANSSPSPYTSTYASLWQNNEARDQQYRNWDFAGGVNYRLSEKQLIGVTVGYLWGPATQALTRSDTSFYGHGRIGVGNDWSYNTRGNSTNQTWQSVGKTYYGGVNVDTDLNPKQKLHFHYNYTKHNGTLSLASSIADTSYGNSRWYYNDTTWSLYSSDSRLIDRRGGTGTTSASYHTAMGSFEWKIKENLRMNVGLQVAVQNTKAETKEAVLSDRFSRYASTGYRYGDSHYALDFEDKDLSWDFQFSRTTFSVPIVFTLRTSETFELMFGLNRKMSRWVIEDVTHALFRSRVQVRDTITTSKTNFGERYTQPKETVSDVETSALFGLTFSPSPLVSIRMLMVPNFSNNPYGGGTDLMNLQWWLGVSFNP